MRKRILLVLVMGIMGLILFSGCNKIISPTESVKAPDQSNIMVDYMKLIKKNASPKELLTFIRPNIKKIGKDDAEIMANTFIKALNNKLQTYDYDGGFDLTLNEYQSVEEIESAKEQMSQKQRRKLIEAYKDGYKLHGVEDGFNLEVSYKFIENEFGSYVSNAYKEYLQIMCETKNNMELHFITIPDSMDEIAEKIIKIENYRRKYPNVLEQKDLTQMNNELYSWYLFGGKYDYTFDTTTKTLKPAALENYKKNQNIYKGSNFSKIISEYMGVLKKNHYKRTKEVFTFTDKVIGFHGEHDF